MKKFKNISFSLYVVCILVILLTAVIVTGLRFRDSDINSNPINGETSNNVGNNTNNENDKPNTGVTEPKPEENPDKELVIEYVITNDCGDNAENGTLYVHKLGNTAFISFELITTSITEYRLSFECSDENIMFNGNDFITINTNSTFPESCSLVITVNVLDAKTNITLNLIFCECE